MIQPTLEAFHAVCANERFGSARDMFPTLAMAARALLGKMDFASELARSLEVYSLREKVRALYLIRLLRGRMEPAVGAFWDRWLAEHPGVTVPDDENLTFFHGDAERADRGCNDDIAKQLGLRKGVNTGKLLQLLRHGTA